MRRALLPVLGLALLAAAACRGALAPKRVPGKDNIERLSIPYPIGDPVTVNSGPRLQLGGSRFMLLRTEVEPRLVGRILVDGERGFAEIYEAAFGRIVYDGHDRVPLSAEVLERAEIRSPGDSVLVVSGEGPCRASLGEAGVELRAGRPRALEISWPLQGCPAEGIAPVAVLVDRLADAVVWRPAVRTVDASGAPNDPWADPLGAATLVPTWAPVEPAEISAVQVWQIPEVDPTVVQVFRGLHRPAPEGAEPCSGLESWVQTNGWWNGQWLDPIEPSDDPIIAPQLIGAFVHDTQVDAIVYLERDAPLVVVPPATGEDGITTEWRFSLVDPGLVLPEGASWGWSMLDRAVGWRSACADAPPLRDPDEG